MIYSKLMNLQSARRQRILGLIIVFALGFMAAWLHVLAPIHEVCHIVASWITGGIGRLDGWTHCLTGGFKGFKFVQYSGYYGEMLVYFLCFGIGMIWKLRVRGMFWFGAAHSTYLISASTGKDFESWSDFGTRDWGAVQALWIFYFVFGVLLVLSWILFIGREHVYQTQILPYSQPKRGPWIEQIRRKYG